MKMTALGPLSVHTQLDGVDPTEDLEYPEIPETKAPDEGETPQDDPLQEETRKGLLRFQDFMKAKKDLVKVKRKKEKALLKYMEQLEEMTSDDLIGTIVDKVA